MHQRAAPYFQDLQDRICSAVEQVDGVGKFREDLWQRPEGGGGRSRILTDGGVFEKAGVNFSEVHGELAEEFAKQIPGEGRSFSATGISLVFHPLNPMVPAVHANFRFLTKGNKQWFGGGSDLTPFYPYREDAIHFHRTWKTVCGRHGPPVDHAKFKKWCDEYFFLPHRNECRGVGGIFFDYLEADVGADPRVCPTPPGPNGGQTRGSAPTALERLFLFVQDCGNSFLDAYLPIVRRRKDEPFGDRERTFQQIRRGRYVEFNLLYDRGTIFGLKTGGRIESILMSLPPTVRWPYDYQPEAGSREAELAEFVKPRDWAAE